ncbi:hypothetical protein BpHYR1_030667, partial [Brachionus plicatilis]
SFSSVQIKQIKIPNNISQDQAFEPNSKGKTRGKGKSYFPFCSFRSLEDTKKCLDREFEGNNWIVKKSDRNLASRYNMIINAIFFKKIYFVYFLRKINTVSESNLGITNYLGGKFALTLYSLANFEVINSHSE